MKLAFLKPIFSQTPNKLTPLINNLEVSVPLLTFENIFTGLHYGHPIIDLNTQSLQIMITLYTYGQDRFKDALENNDSELNNIYYNNQKLYFYFFNILLGIILAQFIVIDDSLPFIILLLSTNFYKTMKSNIPLIKPFYVAFMWTMATFILPCFIYEHNYTILNYPLEYLPLFFNIFGSSNYLDIKDSEEDLKKNIITFPNKFGSQNSKYLSLFMIFLSSILFSLNTHFIDRPIFNIFFECYNVLLCLLIIKHKD
jgi:hypothetical protein